MYKVACTRKEASCIIGTLLAQLRPMCETCDTLKDDAFVLATEDGVVIAATELTAIEGRSVISGAHTKVQFTEYGFELLEGEPEEVQKVRKVRCLYGWLHTAKEV